MHRVRESMTALLRDLLQLALLGLLVGLACWPFNLLDRLQDRQLDRLPTFSGLPWSPLSLALAASPLLVVPLLLLLQRGVWARGAGSGIPQTMVSIETPEQADRLLGPRPTLQRLGLWAAATLSLLPMGREGPVVQVGAAVAQALRRRFPALAPRLAPEHLLALGAGAGLAGGFNTPLMAVVFVMEEFVGRFQAALVWPALVACAVAAAFSNLTGQPMFALGRLSADSPELVQVLWAVPIGLLGGLLGALFGWLLLSFSRWSAPVARRHPLALGLAVGACLSGFLLLSGGSSGGDGERLMVELIRGGGPGDGLGAGVGGTLLALVLRVIGPVLTLGLGIPGGLIDPSFAFGALLGRCVAGLAGLGAMGTALGMAAGLAGATQLPVATVLFALRLAADQQLLPGLLVAAVLA
ncbi:MAG: chloride channel protein, partial [Synechococcaceae cyanobacterium]|nr:chloride channel protein [Synechococcaceae cyanobacterium]